MVEHKAPKEYAHLRSKPKTRKLQEDRAAEIQLENRILLQKMLNIDTKPSQLSAESMTSQRVPPKSLHGSSQRRELDRITEANQDMLRRLQGAKPSINPDKWMDDEIDRQALKYRLSQNSCRGKTYQLPMPPKPVDGRLPRIGGRQGGYFGEDDWAALSNQELDRHLEGLEKNGPPAIE